MDTSFLKGLVPLIGNALSGPLGGAAASFVAEKLELKDKTLAAVSSALTDAKLSPDQIAQLRMSEIEFKKFLEQNKIYLEKIQADNTKSARDMQVATRSKTPEILTFVVTFGFFGVLFYILAFDAKPGEVMLIMLGQLGTAWAAVVGFWFGTTANSSRKTDLLAQAQPIGEVKQS